MLQKRAITLLLNICLVLSVSRAQTFQLMRYDESYADLRDSARTFYHRVKYAPLFNGQVYVSFGGEVRWEFDAFDNEDWGAFHAGKDNFLLQRYDLHADLHLSDRLRFFAQLRSGLENGRPHGPRPIDEDKLNVQNPFWRYPDMEDAKGHLNLPGRKTGNKLWIGQVDFCKGGSQPQAVFYRGQMDVCE